jgi:hypothetical protein
MILETTADCRENFEFALVARLVASWTGPQPGEEGVHVAVRRPGRGQGGGRGMRAPYERGSDLLISRTSGNLKLLHVHPGTHLVHKLFGAAFGQAAHP